MRTFLSFFVLLGLTVTMNAQPTFRRQATNLPGEKLTSNVRSSQYPRILPDNRVIFKINAPEAKNVQIDLGKKYDLKRGEDGAWTCTTEPLSEGFHYYFLIIDGVKVADPGSESFYGCSMMSSGIEIPYPDGDNRFYIADVPHGDIRMNRYYSTVNKCWKRMFVYTPSGYDKSKKDYPVLYLLHGGGEDERG